MPYRDEDEEKQADAARKDVERQLEEDPAPGTAQYMLVQMVDRMMTGENLPPALKGKFSDEKRFNYNREFLKRGYAYLRIREDFPRVPVMLCRKEIAALENALHMASMAYQFHTSADDSMHESFAANALKASIEHERTHAMIKGDESFFSDMAGLAALSAVLTLAREVKPSE